MLQYGRSRERTNRGGYTCPRCKGYGYRRHTDEHQIAEKIGGFWVITHQGCGCSRCLGLGIVEDPRNRDG